MEYALLDDLLHTSDAIYRRHARTIQSEAQARFGKLLQDAATALETYCAQHPNVSRGEIRKACQLRIQEETMRIKREADFLIAKEQELRDQRDRNIWERYGTAESSEEAVSFTG